ncbi:MAG: FliH/SctL family protein, partial [candidate division Zixibacteria bacterium]|nr:FliH/SctL family protein [candidate division Zixibacteria bacterium]
KKLVDKSKIKVKVNPDQLPLMEQQIEHFKGSSTAIKEIIIEPDARVRHCGCFIETPTGDVDARVESQMEIVAETLSEVEGAL